MALGDRVRVDIWDDEAGESVPMVPRLIGFTPTFLRVAPNEPNAPGVLLVLGDRLDPDDALAVTLEYVEDGA